MNPPTLTGLLGQNLEQMKQKLTSGQWKEFVTYLNNSSATLVATKASLTTWTDKTYAEVKRYPTVAGLFSEAPAGATADSGGPEPSPDGTGEWEPLDTLDKIRGVVDRARNL